MSKELTVEGVLSKYKKSISNWESRANNDLPPSNQKGRIIQEIDNEALAAINRIRVQDRLDTLKELSDAGEIQHSVFDYRTEDLENQLIKPKEEQ